MGETREQRLLQYLEENDTPVAALREGAMLRIENGETLLKGSSGARIFRRGLEPVDMSSGEQIDALLQPSTPTSK
jgi:dipeptidase E